jgi:hypothetical protein
VSLCLQTVFHALEVPLFGLRKDAVIIGFSELDQVEDDAREFVRGCRNRFWCSEFGSHPAIEPTHSRFTLLKRLSSHPESDGDAVFNLSRPGPKYFPTTDVVVRA